MKKSQVVFVQSLTTTIIISCRIRNEAIIRITNVSHLLRLNINEFETYCNEPERRKITSQDKILIIITWEFNNYHVGIIAFTRNGTRLRELGGCTRCGGSQGRGAASGEGQRHVEQRSPYATKFKRPYRMQPARIVSDSSNMPV